MDLDSFDDFDEVDELDRLREKSARTSSSFDEMEESGSGIMGWFNRLTPVQKLIIAVLVLVDVIIIGFVIFYMLGLVSF